MAFSAETLSQVRGDSRLEIATLIALAGGVADPTGPVDPDRLFEIARLNKMLGWLPMNPTALPAGCAALAPRLLQVRLRTMAMNRQVMAVTAEVVAALTDAGLRHVVLKGPFQQMAVHDDPFRRPSSDVDLYVEPRDRIRAAAVLQDLGFAPVEQDRALWWISFLGEQHFKRAADGGMIDLHHRLQQAGLPDWRQAGAVLDRADSLRHGEASIPVLSPVDGCLLMAVTLAKSLLAGEACGWAAIDLDHWLARLGPDDRTRLDRVAAASGQSRTLALGIALAQACGGPVTGSMADDAIARHGSLADADLRRDLVFQPWQRTADAPRRRHILWMTTRGRPHVFALEGARSALSQAVRITLERQAAKKASG